MAYRTAFVAFTSFSSFLTGFAAIGPEATLTISNKNISPDGFNRSAAVAGGSHPGPLITGTKGDTFKLNVVNSLTDDTMARTTSIHWHGILQKGSTWADGPAGVSQCPIAPGHSFPYQFDVNNQTGTYWYHSHYRTQYCDGVRGPLVIYDPDDPYKNDYDVDNETTVITLGEWYQLPTPSINGVPIGDSTLINGKGRYVGGPKENLTVINVEKGKRYRIRLVSIACDPNYVFSIDGHNMTIIEADGEYTEKHTVDRAQIYVGQRYSFILDADQDIGNYWIRALPNSLKNMNSSKPFDGGINSAILRYKGADNDEPTSSPIENPKDLKEIDLHALVNPAAPGRPDPDGADFRLNLNPSFNFTTGNFSINGATFPNDTTVPVLLQILKGTFYAKNLMPPGSVYNLKRGQVVELTIPNNATAVGGPHPFHLHGHSFSVVRSAGSNVTNYVNPVRRDVVSIGDPNLSTEVNSNVTIRFVADNAGPWIIHCHIDFHLESGLAVVLAEDAPEVEEENPRPAAWDELCPIYSSLPPSATSIHQIIPGAKLSFVTP